MIQFTFYPEHHLYVSLWTGSVADDEILSAYEAMLDGPEFVAGMNEVADVQANLANVSPRGLERLATRIKQRVHVPFKSAVIARRDLPFGLARVYQAYTDATPELVRVFRNSSDALAWLGVEGLMLSDAS